MTAARAAAAGHAARSRPASAVPSRPNVKCNARRSHIEIGHPSFPQPVEVQVLNSLPRDACEILIAAAIETQRKHPNYVDEFGEESARILTNRPNDPSTVYTFAVGKEPLLFHRHEGHRIINGFTGSAGALMRFSLCTKAEIEADPRVFLSRMVEVILPPNALFVLRFNGSVFHEFGPRSPDHDAFWAVSTHPDELYGLSGKLREQVQRGKASIPLLTDLVPEPALTLHRSARSHPGQIRTLHAPD